MAKYIDADRLKAEIRGRIEWLNPATGDFAEGRRAEMRSLYEFIHSLQQEQPSEDLEEAAEKYSNKHYYETMLEGDLAEGFKAGAEWQKKQFEKNRLAACDAQTREEYERETDFVDKFIAENHRTPTFSDAINYGIAWQKEQMMKDAIEGEAHPDDCEIWANLIGYGYKYNDGDKVKIIIVKEDKE